MSGRATGEMAILLCRPTPGCVKSPGGIGAAAEEAGRRVQVESVAGLLPCDPDGGQRPGSRPIRSFRPQLDEERTRRDGQAPVIHRVPEQHVRACGTLLGAQGPDGSAGDIQDTGLDREVEPRRSAGAGRHCGKRRRRKAEGGAQISSALADDGPVLPLPWVAANGCRAARRAVRVLEDDSEAALSGRQLPRGAVLTLPCTGGWRVGMA